VISLVVLIATTTLAIMFGLWFLSENKKAAELNKARVVAQGAEMEARVHRLLADSASVRWRLENHELSVLLLLQAERFSRPPAGISPEVLTPIQENLLNTLRLQPFAFSFQVAGSRSQPPETERLAFSPDGKLIAVASRLSEIEIVPLEPDPPGCSRPKIRTNGAIRSLDFSSSGHYLVVVTSSGTELFKTPNLACTPGPDQSLPPDLRATVSPELSGPFCTAANDSLLFFALPGRSVDRWGIEQGSLIHQGRLAGDGKSDLSDGTVTTALACNPEGRWVAAGDTSGRITVWTPPSDQSGRILSTRNELEAWPPDLKGDYAFIGKSLDFGVSALIPWESGERLLAAFRHGPPAFVSLPAEPDNQLLLTYLRPTKCGEELLKVLAERGRAGRFLVFKPRVFVAVPDHDRDLLITGGERSMGEWNLRTLFEDYHSTKEIDLGSSPLPNQVFARYSESRVERAPVVALNVVGNGEITATADAESNIRLSFSKGLRNVGSSDNPVQLEGVTGGPNVLYSMCFLHESDTLALGGSRFLTFQDVSSKTLATSRTAGRPCMGRSIRSIAIAPDGRRLALVTRRKTQKIPGCPTSHNWGLNSVLLMNLTQRGSGESPGEIEMLKPEGSEGMWCASWAKGDWKGGCDLLAVGGNAGKVWLWRWDKEGASTIDAIPREIAISPVSSIRSLAFHPSQPYLALGTYDGTLEIRRLAMDGDGTIRTEILPNPGWIQRGPVWALAWSPNGDTLIYGNERGMIGIVPTASFNSNTWKESETRFAHTMGTTVLAFKEAPPASEDPAGRSDAGSVPTLASGGGDGRVKLWSLEPGPEGRRLSPWQPLTLEGPGAEVQAVAFSPDGRIVAAGGANGHVHLWRTELQPVLDEACAAMRRNLSQEEWTQYVGQLPYEKTCINLP
jgi:WD40 repeat protein